MTKGNENKELVSEMLEDEATKEQTSEPADGMSAESEDSEEEFEEDDEDGDDDDDEDEKEDVGF